VPQTSRILIFDNDGTLVPSHEVANPAIQRAFARYVAEHGIDARVPSDQRIRDLTGLPGDEFYRQLLPAAEQHRAADLRTHCLDEEVMEVLARARFYPGLEGMLDRLRTRGDRLVLASHGGERYIGAVGRRLDYPRLFDRVFHHGLDGMTSKVEMGLRALAELGPAPAFFIGDRAADLEAARAIGARFVGCLYGYGSLEELARADALVKDPLELASLILDGDL
jgi:phosphoglycolate phosphatase-like HAD superfamily hydrolase